MNKDKNFTEFNDKELEDWFKQYLFGWISHSTSSKEKFEVVLAEMQRRYIKAQNVANEKLIKLTNILVWLTIVLTIIAGLQIYKSFINP